MVAPGNPDSEWETDEDYFEDVSSGEEMADNPIPLTENEHNVLMSKAYAAVCMHVFMHVCILYCFYSDMCVCVDWIGTSHVCLFVLSVCLVCLSACMYVWRSVYAVVLCCFVV